MSRGRHREQPAPRALPRLRRPLVAAGAGAVLLAVPVVVTLQLNADSTATTHTAVAAAAAITAPDDGRTDAADALRTAAAMRAEARVSRDRTRSPRRAAATARTAVAAKVPAVSGQRWVTTQVNVRSGPSADAGRVAGLEAGAKVAVTGATKGAWTQVVVAGRAGWVKSAYLSASAPRSKASAPAPAGVSSRACSISPSIEVHLTSNARAVYRAVCAAFGHAVSAFGGYRPGDPGDHGSGRAVDIMISGDPGWGVARYVQAHAAALHVSYVIFQQHIWLAGHPTDQWRLMEDRGSRTANHYDHVHVSVT